MTEAAEAFARWHWAQLVVVVLFFVGSSSGQLRAQQPATPTEPNIPNYFGPASNVPFNEKSLFPNPVKPTDPPLSEVRQPDNIGPTSNLPFNEKSLFPNPITPKTPTPDGLPPLPTEDPPIEIPDGTFPPATPTHPSKIWRGGVEFGLNGSQGNTDVLNVRLGGNVDRKVGNNLFHADIVYNLSRQDGVTKQNQALLNARDEILFDGSPWSLFTALQMEYDEFRSYDYRVGAYTGLSYLWVKSEATLLKTRFGAGAVREIDTTGGSVDRWVPEAVLGGDFNHRFTERQGFVSSADVFPNLSQIGQYRVRARAGYEIIIDPTHGMVLRIGAQERYDTSPGTAKRNDLNYFVSMMFKF